MYHDYYFKAHHTLIINKELEYKQASTFVCQALNEEESQDFSQTCDFKASKISAIGLQKHPKASLKRKIREKRMFTPYPMKTQLGRQLGG